MVTATRQMISKLSWAAERRLPALRAIKAPAVALITEILGGLLSGNGLANMVDKGGHGINGVFLEAIAVEEFNRSMNFLDRVDELIAFVKSRKTAPGFKEIRLPGEQGRQNEARQIKEGVEIDQATWTELKQVAEELGFINCPNLCSEHVTPVRIYYLRI